MRGTGLLLLLSAGCTPTLSGPSDPGAAVDPAAEATPPQPSRRSTGSATVVDAGDDRSLYILDDDAQAVLHYDPAMAALASEPLDALPGRITRAGDRVWVTLPADRGIAVLRESADGLVREDTWATGAEPLGIVARADGERLYVAFGTEGEVRELDADGRELRRWTLDGQPSWLALRPDGDDLYVASAFGGHLTWIDLQSGEATDVALPEVQSPNARTRLLSARLTGDPSVSADGSLLAVPVLMTDDGNPVPDDEGSNGYASSGAELSRFNPMVALIALDAPGEPGGASMVLTVAHRNMEGTVRSYLTSATFAPDGSYVLATMEASGIAVVVPVLPYERGLVLDAPISTFVTAGGPRGAAFLEHSVYVDNAFDRTVTGLRTAGLSDTLEVVANNWDADLELAYGASPLDPDVVAGRALFNSAISARMTADGAGVSCSTCHPAGRNDGLVWSLPDGDRQTPSLVGGIAATAPFTWADAVETVAEEVQLTSQERMGGRYLGDGAEQVAAYLESLRAPDVPALGSEDDAVLRGGALFRRSDVGCAACHYGELYTDNLDWPLFELGAVNTPSLRRVSATAPYLHDGRAATLREVLDLAVNGAMGDTSMLSEAELADLEAYLRSI